MSSKKILIISYFYSPCNLTAANRIQNWVQYFPSFEIKPIVITRQWSGNEKTEADRLESIGKKVEIIKEENTEIHALPYKSSWRDKAFIKGQTNRFYAFMSKVLTLMNLIFRNISFKAIPYNNFFYYTSKILRENSDIDTLIISGNPFEQFFFGYRLKKAFPNLKWIADYRDDWTTNELTSSTSLFQSLLKKFNSYFEKKWISNTEFIMSVSDLYSERLSSFHQKKCTLVLNGFNKSILEIEPNRLIDVFHIVYSGTLYGNQNFVPLLNAIKLFSDAKIDIRIKLSFIGSKGSVSNDLQKEFDKYSNDNLLIETTDRVSWEENIALLKGANLLILTSYGNLKGIPTSKLYDYIACETPILLCPSDDDVMKKIIEETQTGIACNSKGECFEFINSVFENESLMNKQTESVMNYSTEQQVRLLSETLKKI